MSDIHKIFIANRGEITRRIGQSIRKMGLKSVTICERVRPPRYLEEVIDEFVFRQDVTTSFYLDGDAMINCARESGCDALHPGFGFLSESADFAQAVVDAGLIWIGPGAKAITQMASKTEARNIATAAAVPCTSALSGLVNLNEATWALIEQFADKTPFPLLVKAAFGGGGKGMRIVTKKADLSESCQRAYSEAKAAFGSGELIIEPYIAQSRHIEVQIMADQHGHTYAIGDRDCSVQRRHQKVIEEAPAPHLSVETRKHLHHAAVILAAKVGYVGAGTVEFLVDWTLESQKASLVPFYFLEMNTRLQVEHPVTEAVFGYDLVEWQIRVAQGEPLPESMSCCQPQGYALEARIYAEDPSQDFLPAPGPILAFIPKYCSGIRWEVGIDPIDEVSPQFDPMIAKCIAHAATRDEARERLATALNETVLAGPRHNLEFLADILREDHFARGAVTTGYLGEFLPDILNRQEERRTVSQTIATQVMEDFVDQLDSNSVGQQSSLSVSEISKRAFASQKNAGLSIAPSFRSEHMVDLQHSDFHRTARLMHGTLATIEHSDACTLVLAVDRGERQLFLVWQGQTFSYKIDEDKIFGDMATEANDGRICAPVPGRVVKLALIQGATVHEDETVAILESMKMEFQIKSPMTAIIGEILVAPGEQVESGQLLVTLD